MPLVRADAVFGVFAPPRPWDEVVHSSAINKNGGEIMKTMAVIYIPLSDVKETPHVQKNRGNGHHAYNGHVTRREKDVLNLIAAGKTNREIADELVLSIRTVERHISNIYRKIGVYNRAQAVRFALEQVAGN